MTVRTPSPSPSTHQMPAWPPNHLVTPHDCSPTPHCHVPRYYVTLTASQTCCVSPPHLLPASTRVRLMTVWISKTSNLNILYIFNEFKHFEIQEFAQEQLYSDYFNTSPLFESHTQTQLSVLNAGFTLSVSKLSDFSGDRRTFLFMKSADHQSNPSPLPLLAHVSPATSVSAGAEAPYPNSPRQ